MAIESDADDIASIVLELLSTETVNVMVVQLILTLTPQWRKKSKRDIFNDNKIKRYKADK